MIRKLFKYRTSGMLHEGPVTLGDGHRAFRVSLHPGLPEDAYRRLFQLDLPLSGTGDLTWDDQIGDWRQT